MLLNIVLRLQYGCIHNWGFFISIKDNTYNIFYPISQDICPLVETTLQNRVTYAIRITSGSPNTKFHNNWRRIVEIGDTNSLKSFSKIRLSLCRFPSDSDLLNLLTCRSQIQTTACIGKEKWRLWVEIPLDPREKRAFYYIG